MISCTYARVILRSFIDMAMGRVSLHDMSGPVGIVSAIGEAVQYGLADVLSLAALITVNLGIFNLLPIPGLDGCKLLFIAIEGITGRAVPEKVQAVINGAGILLLLLLMLFVTFQDITRYFLTGEKEKMMRKLSRGRQDRKHCHRRQQPHRRTDHAQRSRQGHCRQCGAGKTGGRGRLPDRARSLFPHRRTQRSSQPSRRLWISPLVADIHFNYRAALAAAGCRCGQDPHQPRQHRRR